MERGEALLPSWTKGRHLWTLAKSVKELVQSTWNGTVTAAAAQEGSKMEQAEALWLVGELFGKELHKAQHSFELDEEEVEGLEGAIGLITAVLYQVSAGWAESFTDGVRSGTPDLTKSEDGVIISKGR